MLSGGCERAFLFSFLLADAARRFLDKFLVWKAIVAPVLRAWLWQRGIHEIGKVSGSGSRACMKLGSLRLWQQGMREFADSLRLWQQGMHEIDKVSGSGSRACMKLTKSQALAAGHS